MKEQPVHSFDKNDNLVEVQMEQNKPMQLKTESGIAEPMPQSDIQRNNQILLALTMAVYILICIFIWGIWKVLSTGAINNYISACV